MLFCVLFVCFGSAQGPVFRKVLVELDGVAQQWQEVCARTLMHVRI